MTVLDPPEPPDEEPEPPSADDPHADRPTIPTPTPTARAIVRFFFCTEFLLEVTRKRRGPARDPRIRNGSGLPGRAQQLER
ncbi:hypothetical protein GCM10018783_31110 [Streptomyces griseosporeus]|nr:hypothetical protein GCM10018783_31110 [Streptomyces griseosporeus]